jgi:hypothetical protein
MSSMMSVSEHSNRGIFPVRGPHTEACHDDDGAFVASKIRMVTLFDTGKEISDAVHIHKSR